MIGKMPRLRLLLLLLGLAACFGAAANAQTVALVGGTVLSLAPGLPVSGYVATIAFLCYVGCRVVGRVRAAA